MTGSMKDVVKGIADIAKQTKKRLTEEARHSSDYKDIIDALMQAAEQGNTTAVIPGHVRNRVPVNTRPDFGATSPGLDPYVHDALIQDGVKVTRLKGGEWGVMIVEPAEEPRKEMYVILEYINENPALPPRIQLARHRAYESRELAESDARWLGQTRIEPVVLWTKEDAE